MTPRPQRIPRPGELRGSDVRPARRTAELGDWNNIHTAAAYLDRSVGAVRKLERRGLLRAERVYFHDDSKKPTLIFPREELVSFYPRLAGRTSSAPDPDGGGA